MKSLVRIRLLPLLMLLALFIGASFAANDTATNAKINVTKSANMTSATTNTALLATNVSQLKNMSITTNASEIKAVNVSASVTGPTINLSKLKSMIITTNISKIGAVNLSTGLTLPTVDMTKLKKPT